ncbi:MAG: TRAP transporter small permease subunit [Pseudomonadota bacterium]
MATAIWTSACLGAAVLGGVFSWLAVDLPTPRNPVALAGWAAATGIITVFAGLRFGPLRAADQLERAFAMLVSKTASFIKWGVAIMAITQFTAVLLRYVFSVNSIFVQESVVYVHGAVFILSAGYALLTDDHVRVDIFYRDAEPKRRALINLLGAYIFLFPFCLLILWTSSPYVASSWAVFEGSTEQSGIQGIFLLKSLLPLLSLGLAAAGFVTAHRAAGVLTERARP